MSVSIRPLVTDTDRECQRRCTERATHLHVTERRMTQAVTLYVCPVHAGLVPPLGHTVVNRHGEIGQVVTRVFPSWDDADPMVTVEYDDRTEPESIAMLDWEYGTCTHGRFGTSCGADTAPGFDFCGWHGGMDPLPIPAALAR